MKKNIIFILIVLILVGILSTIYYFFGDGAKDNDLGNIIEEEREPDSELSYTMEEINVPNSSFSVTLPQISGVETANKINESILETLKEFGCELESLETNIEVKYNNNNIFSIHGPINFYCNLAAHDARFFKSLTYDVVTGELITFEDLFENTEELTNIILPYHQSEMEACNELHNPESFNYNLNYYISSEGIVFYASTLPTAASICAEDIVVPVLEVSNLSKPNSILSRLE